FRRNCLLHRVWGHLGSHHACVLVLRMNECSLIADVQYADDDDGWNYRQTNRRYYRHGLQVLRWAAAEWIHEAATVSPRMRFAVDLGDVIDGKNEPVGQSLSALRATTTIFDEFQDSVGPVHHCVGNHELYNFSKATYVEELIKHTQSCHVGAESLPPPGTSVAYYTFTDPTLPSYLFVVLDPYGQSVIGSPVDSPEYANAVEFLNVHNPNVNKNSPLGMPRDETLRCTEFNGAVDDAQLAWLAQVLATAASHRQNVVVFSHVPIHPDTCRPGGVLLWNFADVQSMLEQHAGVVRAVFSGHSHRNGYTEDRGIHYMVLHAALECPPSDNDDANRAYATVDVYADGLHVRGAGVIPTRTLAWSAK
ncbi:hypothetical protein DYB30_014113, partial [Aphanomyces astaci]